MTITEKVAYIQGLYDGLGLDAEKSGEARILSEMLDVLKEVGQQLDGMDAAMDQFDEELDALGDSVADLEDAVFDDEDEQDEALDDLDGDQDEDFFEIPCPTCGEDLVVDDEALAGLDVLELHTRNDKPIPAGALLSAEPGIYLPGKFGVRIEDVIMLTEGGCIDITHSPKQLIIL